MKQHLTFHGQTKEMCEWVIKEYDNNDYYPNHQCIDAWVEASKKRLEELDNDD